MWKKVKLGDICNFVRGPFGGSLKKNEFVERGYAVYEQMHAIRNQCEEFRYYINETKFNEMSRFEVKAGDILMSCSGTIGKTTIVPEHHAKGIINQALLKISTTSIIDVVFLKLFMSSEHFFSQLMSTVGGAAIKNVASVKILKEITISLPPLAEQRRIVSKLDTAFAEIDTAIAASERNIANAFSLNEAIIAEAFSNIDADMRALDEVSEITNGYAFKSSDFIKTVGTKCIKITNVGLKEFVETDDDYLPVNFSKLHKRFRVKEGSIVFALTRTIINGGLKVAKVPVSYDGALLNQRVASVSAKNDIILSSYLYFFLSSNTVKQYVIDHVNTLMQPNLSINDLRSLPVPCVSLEQQKSIAKAIQTAISNAQLLIQKYSERTKELKGLKSSLLTTALTNISEAA